MPQSPPSSLTQFQMPNVQKANEGKCQKVVDQDTLEAKYVFGFCSYLDLPLFDTCLHLQKVVIQDITISSLNISQLMNIILTF